MTRNPDKGHYALRRGRVSLPNQIYNVTATTANREPVFRAYAGACAACPSFEDSALLGDAQMLAWVLMPDHAHWLLQLGERGTLDSVIRQLKSASARAANAALYRKGALWARGYHDHGLRREEEVVTVARYIISNPVRAGLVARVGDYPFWNAVWIGAK